MEISTHGIERIQKRTKMSRKNILAMVAEGKVIDLEIPGSYVYLLFFSPPDVCTKIAIVSLDRKTLVTIFESDFNLPRGRVVTNAQNAKARSLAVPGELQAEIRVYKGSEQIYIHPAGTIERGDCYFIDTTVKAIAAPLQEVIAVIEMQSHTTRNQVWYDFKFFDPVVQKWLTNNQRLKHKNAIRYLGSV